MDTHIKGLAEYWESSVPIVVSSVLAPIVISIVFLPPIASKHSDCSRHSELCHRERETERDLPLLLFGVSEFRYGSR